MVPGGMCDWQAVEFAKLIDAGGPFDPVVIGRFGYPDYAAREMADQMNAGKVDAERLAFYCGAGAEFANALHDAMTKETA